MLYLVINLQACNKIYYIQYSPKRFFFKFKIFNNGIIRAVFVFTFYSRIHISSVLSLIVIVADIRQEMYILSVNYRIKY